MINVLKAITSLLFIAFPAFLLCVINVRKTHRVRQVFLPIIFGIFSIVGAVILSFHVDDFNSYMEQNLPENEFVPYCYILVFNFFILIAMVILKAIVCPVNSLIIKDKKKVLDFAATGFYEYSEDYSEWFLMTKWVNFRGFLRAVVIGTTIATAAFLALAWILGQYFGVFTYLSIALTIICEFYNFVNGQTKEEFEHSFLGMEADSRRISSYFKVREIFEKLLPEPLLCAHTGMEYMGNKSSIDLLKALSKSNDEADKLTARFFSVNDRYKTADPDCVTSTVKMMHRKNVVFFDPFYRDLSLYITLPLVNALLKGQKCVIITGRQSNTEDIIRWISDLIKDYSHMKTLWRTAELNANEPECEIGVLSFPQLYNNKVISANKHFFNDTDFVMLVEPSVILNTGQVALNIIANEFQSDGNQPVYCVCDRRVDGLIDTLSHLLKTELTEVTAAPLPRCVYSGIAWDADGDFQRRVLFDKQSRYLGNGVELAAIAVKNQIPRVTWFSETKAPVRDIKWLAGQYYPAICKYMNQPIQQEVLYEKIGFVSNLWSTEREDERFIIAEDEFCNIFETMRVYLSQGKRQSFVNVLSQNYLLRDYMRCNKQMFISNPDVIPSIVPDYAKTERNTLIKLILTMTFRPVTDAEVIDEFQLVGLESDDSLDILIRMLKKYTYADNSILTVHTVRSRADENTTISTLRYTIDPDVFETYFSDSLKNAYFIIEDEKTEREYIDAKLFSHITQKVLPGQFITYDGKYYLVRRISPQSGVILRRASDLYDGRKYYRQLRSYELSFPEAENIVSRKTVMDIEISTLSADIKVETSGYLELSDDHNLRTARLVDLSDDPFLENYSRRYHNKTVLRVKYPESDDRTRFTLCMLFSEIFKSIFPDGWQYIAVVSGRPDDIEGFLNYMVYPVNGDYDSDYIYFIEDSDIDLGLLESIERNLNKLTEIIADFLEWHIEKLHEPEAKDPAPVSVKIEIEQKKKKQGLFSRMANRIRMLFGGKVDEKPTDFSTPVAPSPVPENTEPESKPEATVPEPADTVPDADTEIISKENTSDISEPAENTEGTDFTLDEPTAEASQSEQPESPEPISDDAVQTWSPTEGSESDSESGGDPEILDIDGTDIFDTAGLSETDRYLEDQFRILGLTGASKTRYQLNCFLKFGFEEIDSRLHIEELIQYLRVRGWCNNYLTKARHFDLSVDTDLDLEAVNHCDFCGLPLTGVSYEQMNDGRIRCNDCSASAITTVEDFRELFCQILDMMEAFFNIKFKIPIKVLMLDAREVAKRSGVLFTPSTGMAPRSLGFAQKKRNNYSIVVENGSPRLAAIDTVVHELTHIWQFINWNSDQISQVFGLKNDACTAKASDIVYEGMAMWASVQYLYLMGETYYAACQEALAESRNDIYGMGFRLYREQYPLIKDTSLIKYSPYYSFPPLEPANVIKAVRNSCTDPECQC